VKTRATQVDYYSKPRARPRVLMRLRKDAEMRKRYIAQIPRWRHPLVGYVVSVPVVGLAMLGVMLGKAFLLAFSFSGVVMFLAVVGVALFWGVGPALFSVLLSALALNYFYLPPIGQITSLSWTSMLQILPFIVSGIIIAIITGQRESARLRALFAEQEAEERAADLEESNHELEQVNQTKDQFLSMASHELKTPITSIRGQAQIMLRRLAKQKELPKELVDVRTALESIDEQTQRLNALVGDLLDLSTIRSGKIELRLSRCDLCDVCRDAVKDQQLLTERTIELELPSSSVTLKADCDRLNQVVSNLVSNALKYSLEESSVQVMVCQQDTCVRIAVRDAGQGIPKDQQTLIFEPFYRTPNAQTSKKSGWGLGLAICKDIVERHGGHIWCESERGKGSTFFVELPLK
jgi:signal transduction histidine kinase